MRLRNINFRSQKEADDRAGLRAALGLVVFDWNQRGIKVITVDGGHAFTPDSPFFMADLFVLAAYGTDLWKLLAVEGSAAA